MTTIKITSHAAERMQERRITYRQIVLCLAHGTQTDERLGALRVTLHGVTVVVTIHGKRHPVATILTCWRADT